MCLLCALALLAFGCGGGATVAPDTGESSVVVAESSQPEATTGAAAGPPETPPEQSPEKGEFVSDPEAAGGSGSAADSLLAVRHGYEDGYERVVLDLGVGESPTETVPEWTLKTPEDDGLLRVSVPSASTTYVSEGRLGDKTLRGFHVVRDPDGGVFVDIASREAFSYRVFGLEDPARIVVDFASAGMRPLKPLPKQSAKTVLDSPRAGEDVSDPITISGYSRNFEGENQISLLDRSGEVISRTSAQSNDWSETWGYFETTLDLPDYTGRATLKVGAASPRNGKFEGVEVPVNVTR